MVGFYQNFPNFSIYSLRYLSSCLFIRGTKKIIQKKTVGQDIINLLSHAEKKLLISGFIIIRIAETVVLVQNDMITAKIINLLFFNFNLIFL